MTSQDFESIITERRIGETLEEAESYIRFLHERAKQVLDEMECEKIVVPF